MGSEGENPYKGAERRGDTLTEIHQPSLLLGQMLARLDNIDKTMDNFNTEIKEMSRVLNASRVKMGGATVGLSLLLTLALNYIIKGG